MGGVKGGKEGGVKGMDTWYATCVVLICTAHELNMYVCESFFIERLHNKFIMSTCTVYVMLNFSCTHCPS